MTQITEEAARQLVDKISPITVWIESLTSSASVESFLFNVADRTGHPMGSQLVIVAYGSRKACETINQAVKVISSSDAPQA
jgi:hypothetical protein